jgi:hypothetical protein
MLKKLFKSEDKIEPINNVESINNEIILKPSLYIGQIFYCLLDGRIEKVVIDRIDINIYSTYMKMVDGKLTITCNGELQNIFKYNGRIDRLDKNCFLYVANNNPYFAEYSPIPSVRTKYVYLYKTVEEVIKLIEKS